MTNENWHPPYKGYEGEDWMGIVFLFLFLFGILGLIGGFLFLINLIIKVI